MFASKRKRKGFLAAFDLIEILKELLRNEIVKFVSPFYCKTHVVYIGINILIYKTKLYSTWVQSKFCWFVSIYIYVANEVKSKTLNHLSPQDAKLTNL